MKAGVVAQILSYHSSNTNSRRDYVNHSSSFDNKLKLTVEVYVIFVNLCLFFYHLISKFTISEDKHAYQSSLPTVLHNYHTLIAFQDIRLYYPVFFLSASLHPFLNLPHQSPQMHYYFLAPLMAWLKYSNIL